MSYLDEADEVIKGIFLLLMSLSGNFVAETLGCKTQKLLSENMMAKHFVIILMLYFAVNFTSDNPGTPLETFKLSLIIYVLFILFTKMSLEFTILIFILLAIVYVFGSYIDYYKKNDKDTQLINRLEYVRRIIYIVMTVLIIIGFGLYFMKQRKDHFNNWSTTKFIFGSRKCNSLI